MLSKYFSTSLQRSVSRGKVVSRSVVLREENTNISGIANTLGELRKYSRRERGETELRREIRDPSHVTKLDFGV